MAAPAAAILAALALVPGAPNRAADHLDPPTRTDANLDPTPDLPADIADIFAWHADGTVKIVLTFGGPSSPSLPGFYDREVLYQILISTSAPSDTAEIVIRARFGRGQGPDEWGVRVEGLPGVAGVIEGPVETELEKDGVRVRAGLFDDPFFFDARGLRESRTLGAVRIDNKRDFFAAQNDTALVLEIPIDRFAGATAPLEVSTTTSRIGGQL